jgi:hypothetical protein
MKIGKILAVVGLSALGLAMSPDGEARGAQMSDPFPVWDQRISASQRFVPRLKTFGIPGAYLDQETGLLWTAGPHEGTVLSWAGAFDFCVRLRVGGRGGWRLPLLEELLSLLPLPPGSPFANPGNVGFFSATTVPDDRSAVYARSASGTLDRVGKTQGSGFRPWCVRGGRGATPAP